MLAFLKQPEEFRSITFYAEDDHSFAHFKDIIHELTTVHKQPVSYLTSQEDDPILELENSFLKAFFIGEGMVRTNLFYRLNSNIFLMTMPDIETFHLKRSKVYPVHYIYIFHAMVSTYSVYRKGAFNHYDTILCTGPHHDLEIRATEKLYNLKPKKLVHAGYPHLEALIHRHSEDIKTLQEKTEDTILLAPTWGENSILESCGEEVIELILETGYQLFVRPHPMTTKHNPHLIDSLREMYSDRDNFTLETNIANRTSIIQSKILITDWSGISLEYSFTNEKPVIYIDVPRKCNNPDANKIGTNPIEVSIRNEIGKIVQPSNLAELLTIVPDMMKNQEKYAKKAIAARSKHVFNLGNSVSKSCQAILETLKSLKQRTS